MKRLLSYCDRKPRHFRFRDANTNQEFFFKFIFPGGAVAVIQFFREKSFITQTPIPPAFTMQCNTTKKTVHPYEGKLFVVQYEDYNFYYNGTPVWQLQNPRQQAMNFLNSDVVSLDE